MTRKRTAVRTAQCDACPWKVSTAPDKDIPGGYCPSRHRSLKKTIAEPGGEDPTEWRAAR